MFDYDIKKIQVLMEAVIMDNSSKEVYDWLLKQQLLSANITALNTAFAMMPRKTGKTMITVQSAEQEKLTELCPGFSIENWSIDRLCRVWLLTQLPYENKESYFNSIENLFRSAAVNELVALYSSLPLLVYPAMWTNRCAEGIRSNIGDVLEAIMYYNPYPAAHLNEAAWNQMILKAIFTNKHLPCIVGLDSRANKDLAYTLSDYAHERWAAHRSVPPQLWHLLGKFIDEKLLTDIQKALATDEPLTKKAAALAITASGYPPAKELLHHYPELQAAIASNSLSWEKDIAAQ